MRRIALVVLLVGVGCSADTVRSASPSPRRHAAARPGPTTAAAGREIGARISNEELRFTQRGGLWRATNRATNLRARFGSEGVALTSRTGASDPWTITLRTRAIGRAGAMRELSNAAPRAGACDEHAGEPATAGCLRRLEIDRGRGVVERWRNGARGLEQEFEVAAPSEGHGPLVIEVSFSGVSAGRTDGQSLTLRARGEDAVRYAELVVLDATGAALPAKMRWRDHAVALLVDDRAARYPILVDPLLSEADWTAEADQTEAQLGMAVSAAGDVDGDGFDDVIVGAPGWDGGQTDEGRVFVFHGSAGGLEVAARWTAESDQEAWDNGDYYPCLFGTAVASAGDVDGDGFDDILVGARNYRSGLDGEGRAFLYRGSASGLEAAPSWTADGDQEWAEYGWSVAGAGDVDGDGYDDVIIGGRNYSNGQAYEGRAYLYRGSVVGLEAAPSWTAESDFGLAHFGQAVAGGGDVNGDGYDDVVVIEESGGEGVYCFLGSGSGLEGVASWAAVPGGPGYAVSVAGDVNGDGFDDLVGGSGGGAFLYLGSAAGLGDQPAWTAVTDQVDRFNFGWSVSMAGDVNADGFDDVIVGEYDYANPAIDEGRALAYHGSADGLGARAQWMAESNEAGAQFGWSVSAAGDVDDDGFDDVIVGAPFFGGGEQNEGRAFLFRGSVDDGVPCDGGLWRSSECDDSHCFLGGVWYLNGDTNPGNSCEVCLVATSQLAWSTAPDTTECAWGICRAGSCEASCFIGGTWATDGSHNPEDECEVCLAGTSPTAWTSAPEGSACEGGLCREGRCDTAECYIDGAWIVNAAASPNAECVECAVDTDRTRWTNAPEGTPCDGGLCRDGACHDDRCFIEGAWYVDGAASPSDDCRVCDVSASRVQWSGGECPDAGPGGGGDDSSGGCSCRLGGQHGAGGSGADLSALVILLALRRRRARVSR